MSTTAKELTDLGKGDIVRYRNGDSYVVIRPATAAAAALGIREISISNPSEWTIVQRHDWDKESKNESTESTD